MVLLDGPIITLRRTEPEVLHRFDEYTSQTLVIWLGMKFVRENFLSELEEAVGWRIFLAATAEVLRRHGHLGLLDNLKLVLLTFTLDLIDKSEPVHVQKEDEVVDEGDQIIAPTCAHEVEGVLASEQHRSFELVLLAILNVVTIFIQVVRHETEVYQT